jgi:uncharacterized protein YbcV (DUF1398 family)
MDRHVTDVMQSVTAGSDDNSISFPDVVLTLTGIGVERYHADLLRAEKTYYMPDGASHVTPTHVIATAPAQAFSPAGVAAAVRASQARTIDYREFCARITAAGCVDYIVSLAGRRAVYFGRTGESYVEPFPQTT